MDHVRSFFARAVHPGRRVRIAALVIAALWAIFTLGGFFGVPLLLRHYVSTSLSAQLHRRAAVDAVRFNPYTLRLAAEGFHVDERTGSGEFARVGRLMVKASWSSVYRRAPIIQELIIERPALHLARGRDQRFNFADLTESSKPAPASTPRRWLFSVSNIQVRGGRIRFDDEAFNEHHTVDRIDAGIPFIANLPADVEIFVQPLLRMVVDGSPFRMAGIARPFASTPESILEFRLKRFDLTRVAAYLKHTIPIKIPAGALSTNLQLQFRRPLTGPEIRLAGKVKVEGLDLRDAANAPLAGVKTARIALINVDPIHRIVILGDIGVDGFSSGLVRDPNGKTNFTPLLAGLGKSGQTKSTAPPGSSTYLFVKSFNLSGGQFNLRDNTGAAPLTVTLKEVGFGFRNFDTDRRAAPFPFQAQAHIGDGSVAISGTFDLAHSAAAAQAGVDKIDLPPLQALAQPFWAGTLSSGKLSAQAKLKADLTRFNVQVRPATVSLTGVELRAPGQAQQPLQINQLEATVDDFDLAARRADVKLLHVDQMRLFVRRAADGSISLSSFLWPRPAPSSAGPPPAEVQHQPVMSMPGAAPQSATAPSSAWQYRVQSIAVENVDAGVEDDRAPTPITIQIAPLNLHLKNVSSDFSQAFALEAEGALKPGGGFKAEGTAAINPLAAKIHITTTKLDLTAAEVYLGERINAKITRAGLDMNGDFELKRARDAMRMRYRGDVMLARVRVQDKVTGERFLRWNALRAARMDAEIGNGAPRVAIGEAIFSDFYTRLILDSNGKLNLRDLTAARKAPAASGREAPRPEAATQPKTAPGIGADVKVARITLQGGAVNYTDNFIRPHYSANLTHIEGKIGAVSTRSTRPADVELRGELNSSAPIDITGSISPLAPQPFVDLKAKAEGVELSNLSPYSAKYTGYPITKGTLNVNVHYLLENQQLTATNHIFISQLTFGSKVQSPNAINLPIAMAVDLLKNARGEIDVSVPVSGSLNDPEFSFGAVILTALKNLVLKVVSSPFSMLASIAGASKERLDHVEFAPGQSALTPAAVQKLSILAKAMQDRPALRLTISGRADPAVDRPGLRDAMVDARVKAQKVNELRDRGETVELASVTLSPDEYDRYLKMAYKHAKFDKPRNFLGLDKSIPPDEMKKLMLANTKVTDRDLKELANSRAVAVRKLLSKTINSDRLAVGPPNIGAGAKDNVSQTRVDLSLQ